MLVANFLGQKSFFLYLSTEVKSPCSCKPPTRYVLNFKRGTKAEDTRRACPRKVPRVLLDYTLFTYVALESKAGHS